MTNETQTEDNKINPYGFDYAETELQNTHGFKFNFTAKERALKCLEEEAREKKSIVKTKQEELKNDRNTR